MAQHIRRGFPWWRRDPATILLGVLLPIGDLLFCQPALMAVRRRFPAARITALTSSQLAPLLADFPAIDDLFIHDTTPDGNLIARLDATLQFIHARRFDHFISFSTGTNSLGLLTAIPRQTWQVLPRAFYLTGTLLDPPFRARHAVDHYWQVVRPLGCFPRDWLDRVPYWHVPHAERREAAERLRAADLAPERGIVLLHPGAAGFGGRKRWPVERFAELAAHLVTGGQQVAVLGGPDDRAAALAIAQATEGRARSFAGDLSLRQSLAMITHASIYVGCDSGLTHFALALGTPAVALFGMSDLMQFAPRERDPHLLRLMLPQPLPPPLVTFIGTESLFDLMRHRPDDRMATISVERVRSAIASLQRHYSAGGGAPVVVESGEAGGESD